MALLEVNGIGKSFGTTKVLRDISFELAEGEALAIIGSSGSGKTTLLRCLNFLETADAGSITVAGETLWSAADTRTQSEEAILSLIHISEPTRPRLSRMPSSA